MAQIQAPYTFVTGDQVTAANLNAHTNSAILLPGSITDQPDIAANTVAANDSVALHDLSASTLKEATVGDLLNSGLNITTGAIAGKTGVDLVITPAAGQKVDVAGNIEADDVNVTDDLTVGDDATISGDLVVTGSSTLTGNVIADNGFTSNGLANFAGTLQYKSTPIYGLFNISTFSLTGSIGYVDTIWNVRISIGANWAVAGGNAPGAGGGVHWNESHTIPTGEMWEITWHWFVMRGGDDYFAVGVIRRQDGGSWIQIEDLRPQPISYTNTPVTTVEVLTNTSGSPVTYDYSFKSAWGGGSGTDQAIVISGNGAVRVIRKYKIA